MIARLVAKTDSKIRAGFLPVMTIAIGLYLTAGVLLRSYLALLPAQGETYLLWQEMRVPGTLGSSFARVGWAEERITELQGRLPSTATVSRLRHERRLLTSEQGVQSAIQVGMDPDGVAALLEIESGGCRDPRYFASPGVVARWGREVTAEDGRSYSLTAVESINRVQGLSSGLREALLIRCEASPPGQIASDLLLVRDDAALKHRLQDLSSAPEFSSTQDFARSLRFERLDRRLFQHANALMGWVPPLGWVSWLICLMAAFAQANLLALRNLHATRLKLLLGSTPRKLLMESTWRALLWTFPAAVLAAVPVALFAVRSADWAELEFLALAGNAAAALLSTVAVMVVTQFVWLRLRGHRLTTITAGNRASTTVWPYFLAWSTGLMACFGLVLIAVAVESNLRAIERIDTGFDFVGRYSIPLHLAAVDLGQDPLGLIERQLRADLPGAQVGFVCPAPWRFSGFDFLERDDNATGVGVQASAGWFDALGLKPLRGRFFVHAEVNQKVAVVQTPRAEALQVWSRLFQVTGEVDQIKFGAFAPGFRPAIFTPLTEAACTPMDLLVQPGAANLRSMQTALSELVSRFPRSYIGTAQELRLIYDEARRPLRNLAYLIRALVVLTLGMSISLTSSLAGALLNAHRKDLAVRLALGAPARLLVWQMTRRTGSWLVLAVLFGLALGWIGQRWVSSTQLSWQVTDLWILGAISIAFAALVQLATTLLFVPAIRDPSLTHALSTDA